MEKAARRRVRRVETSAARRRWKLPPTGTQDCKRREGQLRGLSRFRRIANEMKIPRRSCKLPESPSKRAGESSHLESRRVVAEQEANLQHPLRRRQLSTAMPS